jgi:hypothetical protein
MKPVKGAISVLTRTVLLDVSGRTDTPAEQLRDLRVELANISQSEHRYSDVIICGDVWLVRLLRLLRWDIVFDMQEVTGLPPPRHIRYYWKRAQPRVKLNDNGERP